MPRHWLTIALLIVLIGSGMMLLNSPPQVLQPDSTESGRDQVQLTGYLTGVNTTQYSDAGHVEYNFTAEQMSYFQPDPDSTSPDDYTTINMPFFAFHQVDGQTWYARSERGRSMQNDEVVILKEDVRVWRNNEAAQPTVIATSELVIRPQAQVAETDEFVTITHPRTVSRGVGMRADLKQETFAILSQGNTIYEPNP